VPIIGWLFKQREQTGSRVERLFMITPRLVEPRVAATAPPATQNTAWPATLPDAPAP
jgi:type II secretory pathway component GspD/PulD (secretin)